MFPCRITYRKHAWCSSVTRSSWNSLTGIHPRRTQNTTHENYCVAPMYHGKANFIFYQKKNNNNFISFPSEFWCLMTAYNWLLKTTNICFLCFILTLHLVTQDDSRVVDITIDDFLGLSHEKKFIFWIVTELWPLET